MQPKPPNQTAAEVVRRVRQKVAQDGLATVAKYLDMPASDLVRALDEEKPSTFTERDVWQRIKGLTEQYGVRGAARHLNVSAQLLSAILRRTRAIGPTVLRSLGLRRIVAFEERRSRTARRIRSDSVNDTA